jgi:tRNA dimethylallyltransferase
MFAAGVEREVRDAGAVGPTASQTLGWREIRALLDGRMSRAECVAAIQLATRRYAKRQMTWFRRETQLEMIGLSGIGNPEPVMEAAAKRALAGR